MYKYTASKTILSIYNNILKKSKNPYNEKYSLAKAILGSKEAFFRFNDFWDLYKHFEYYSPTYLDNVPMFGTPVKNIFFHIEEIKND